MINPSAGSPDICTSYILSAGQLNPPDESVIQDALVIGSGLFWTVVYTLSYIWCIRDRYTGTPLEWMQIEQERARKCTDNYSVYSCLGVFLSRRAFLQPNGARRFS